MAAPVVAITATDLKFYDHLPFLFPHADAKPWFTGNEAFAKEAGFRNGSMQVAYLILALARRRPRHRPDERLRQCQGRCGILPRRAV